MTDQIVVQLPDWLRRSHSLQSRELIGTIERSSTKGLLFAGHANIRQAVNCLRCGRELDNDISRAVGYGPVCSDELGIPRDVDDIEAIAKLLTEHTHTRLWLPKTHVTMHTLDGDNYELPEVQADTRTSTVTVEGRQIVLCTHFDLKEKAKQAGGARWNPKRKAWIYPASPATAQAIVDAYRNEHLTHSDEFDQLLAEAHIATEAQTAKTAEAGQLEPIERTATTPWHHQLQGYHFGYNLRAVMYAIEMGGGKSKINVDLMVNRDARNILIICPNSVLGVWPREFRTHAAGEVDVYDFRGRKTIAKRIVELDKRMKLAHTRGVPFVVVINFEAFFREPFMRWAQRQVWDEMSIDEAHRIKKPGGKWSMAATKLGRQAKRRLANTGTLMGNSPLDVYGPFRYLDPGIFGTSYHRFRQRYAVMGGFDNHQVVAYRMLPTMRDPHTGVEVDNPYHSEALEREFNEKLYSITFRVGEEVMDLPDHLDQRIDVELTPKARKLYEDLTARWIAEHEESGGVFTARNVLTRMLRQQQITGGSINDDEGTNIEVDDSKERALDDFLKDLPLEEPLVVFCRFIHDLRVVERLARKYKLRYGELSGRRKDALNDDAQMAANVDIAAVQIQAGGVGIDLTRARYSLYYSLGSSLVEFDQSRKRVRRPGQTRPVTYFHLVSIGTVDEKVYAALAAKRDVVDYLMEEGTDR